MTVRSAGYRLVAPIQRSVAVWDGGVIYIAGGLDAADTTVGGVFSMDPTSGRLTPLGSLAQPVHDAAAAMIGGKLYVFAGGTGTGSDIVQAFDPATGTGSVVGHLPVALSGSGARHRSAASPIWSVGTTAPSRVPRSTRPRTERRSRRSDTSRSACATRR